MKISNEHIEQLKERLKKAEELANKTSTFQVKADAITYVEEGLEHNLKAEDPQLAEDLSGIIGVKIYEELLQYVSYLEGEVNYWTEQQEEAERKEAEA